MNTMQCSMHKMLADKACT